MSGKTKIDWRAELFPPEIALLEQIERAWKRHREMANECGARVAKLRNMGNQRGRRKVRPADEEKPQ